MRRAAGRALACLDAAGDDGELSVAAARLATSPAAPSPSSPAHLGSRSSAGDAINKRMQQLAAQVQAELGPEQTGLDADIKAFREKAASLPQDQQQQQGQALQQRMQEFDNKRAQRQKELETTLRKAINRVDVELEPIVRTVVSGRSCGLLLKADTAIYAANPQMDITSSVIEQLNTKLPTVTFDREHIDPQAAQQR